MTKAIKELEKFKKPQALIQADQVPAAAPVAAAAAKPSFKKEYEDAYLASVYKKHPSVADLKELVENQYKRTDAAHKILRSLQKKINDGNEEIRSLDADIARLKKQETEAKKKSAAVKKKADALDKKTKDGLAAAAKFKDESIAKPLAVMKKAQDAQTKEQASKAKAQKTLKFMQQIQKEEAQKVNNAKAHLSMADTALANQ